MATDAARAPHPCLRSDCGHPDTDHVATPELASSTEIVVWCAGCQHHEVRRPRRFHLPWSRTMEHPAAGRRFSRPG